MVYYSLQNRIGIGGMKVEHGVKAVVSGEVMFVGVIVDSSLFTLCCHFVSFIISGWQFGVFFWS